MAAYDRLDQAFYKHIIATDDDYHREFTQLLISQQHNIYPDKQQLVLFSNTEQVYTA